MREEADEGDHTQSEYEAALFQQASKIKTSKQTNKHARPWSPRVVT